MKTVATADGRALALEDDAPGARARMTALRKLGLWGATRAPALLRAGMWLIGLYSPAPGCGRISSAATPRRCARATAASPTRWGCSRDRGDSRCATSACRFRIWHGQQDTSTPIEMAQYLAAEIPGATTHFFPGEGHFVILDHYREILDQLLASRRAPAQPGSLAPITS